MRVVSMWAVLALFGMGCLFGVGCKKDTKPTKEKLGVSDPPAKKKQPVRAVPTTVGEEAKALDELDEAREAMHEAVAKEVADDEADEEMARLLDEREERNAAMAEEEEAEADEEMERLLEEREERHAAEAEQEEDNTPTMSSNEIRALCEDAYRDARKDKNYWSACTKLSRAFALWPEVKCSTMQNIGGAGPQAAWWCMKAGNYGQCVAHATRCTETFARASLDELKHSRARCFYNRGACEAKQGNKAAAQRSYSRAVDTYPDTAKGNKDAARACKKLKSYNARCNR